MKTSGNDLIDTDVYGTQNQVKEYSLFQTLYQEFYNIDFNDTFFALNVTETVPEKILNHPFKKIVISYHIEHIHYQLLYDIVVNNKDKHFLLISDFDSFDIKDDEAEFNFWPNNVTPIQWLSWGEQISKAKKISGIAELPKFPTKKLSSLANRHEYHKAAITAYILNNFLMEDTIISWHKWNAREEIYYLADDYSIDKKIKQQLSSKKFLETESIEFDIFDNSLNTPNINIHWDNAAYLDCAVNITNESTFSSIGVISTDRSVAIPGPFITEKTIKPLLSGTAFLHVGQPFLLRKLNELGIDTNFGFPSDYDNEPFEDDRILKIYKSIEFIMNSTIDELYQNSYDAIVNNLDCIKNGVFYNNCKKHNNKHVDKIYEWSLINP